MNEKKAKNRKNKRMRLRTKKRRERMKNISLWAFLLVCIGAVALVPVINRSMEPEDASWYVEGGTVEIAAQPMDASAASSNYITADSRHENFSSAILPELTLPPTRSMATAQPTIPPMEIAEEEAWVDSNSRSVTITAVGDCTLGGNATSGGDDRFDAYVERYGYDYFFENVRHLFEADDLTIVNLEGPLTSSKNMRSGRTFNFRGKTGYVNILSGSSVEICNIANNHALDFGESGLQETARVLANEGIGVSGFSRSYSTTVKGVRVCSLGFTKWAYTEKQIKKAVAAARGTCDLLIVSMHWGEEGIYKTSSDQRSLGHAIIDAGADLVIGHHPHVYGGIEKYEGKYIVYSLGNFCFGGNKNPSDKRCLIFQQTFEFSADGKVVDAGINIIPAAVTGSSSNNDFQPIIMPLDRGTTLIKNVGKVSKLSMNSITWMDEGYMVQNGLVTLKAAE